MAGLSRFTVITNIFVTEFAEFSETFKKAPINVLTFSVNFINAINAGRDMFLLIFFLVERNPYFLK